MTGMEASFISEVKKQKITFGNLLKSFQKNEVFEFRKNELKKILEEIKPQAVFVDIFISTDYLVLKALKQTKVFLVNPLPSTNRIEGFPTLSEGSWQKSKEIKFELKTHQKKWRWSNLLNP